MARRPPKNAIPAALLSAAIIFAVGVVLPQVSLAGKKRAHPAKLKKRAASCQGTVVPASSSVRPRGRLYVSGKACAKGTVKIQQSQDGSWITLGKTTASRSGDFATCLSLADAAVGSSVQLRAVASNGSKAFSAVQVSNQGTDTCSPTPVPAGTPEPTPVPTDPPPLPSYALTLSVTGGGSVTGTGINCPGDCSQSFPSGTPVTLTATPAAGASFSGWGGACSGAATTCTVTMSANKSLSASFASSQPPPPPPTGDIPPGLSLLREDLATNPDPLPLWGQFDAVSMDRHTWFSSGGPDGGPYRRITVRDGDDFDGERAELGESDYRSTTTKPFYLYWGGMRRVTAFWMRLPTDFPISPGAERWQNVMQMKQTSPATNDSGTPVIVIQATDGGWLLKQADSAGPSEDMQVLWRTPAALGAWTRIVIDATYSNDPAVGQISVTIGGVKSPVFHTYTLKTESSPPGPGLTAGGPVPSHLRMGIYHDSSLPGTHVDISDVQIFG